MKKFLSFLLILGVVFSMAAVGGAAAKNNKVDVFVSFDKTPGPAERAIVNRVGGTVRYSYTIVPAVAASVPETAIQGLLNNPRVTSVELDGTVYAVDAELTNAWGVERIGSGTVHNGGNKAAGVKIGIIDSGVDYTHSDLNDVYVGGYDFVENQNDLEVREGDGAMDVYGHGTHVAGSACAEDNGLGVVGVAPDCSLYSLRVLNNSGVGSWSATVAAMDWAVLNGLQVVNLSLGDSQDPGSTVQAAFDNAEAAGLVIVAAGGNSGNPPGKGNNVIYPAKYASVIAVAATDSNNKRPNWSSTGEEIELAAPGVSVLSTWNDGDSPHNPQPIFLDGDYYKEGSGTSMASPHVAGAAALVIAAGVTNNDDVRAILSSTADDIGAIGKDTHYGYGLVNVAAAVAAITPPSTGTISGTVADADTLDPIAGATVSDGTRLATTDANGAYAIADVPEGTYTVVASATGYQGASQSVVVTGNSTSTLNFALQAATEATTAIVNSIAYTIDGGKNSDKHLNIHVAVVDDFGNSVAGASVSIDLSHDGSVIGSGIGTTSSNGTAIFSLKNAPSGHYETLITNVLASGLIWDNNTPPNGYDK